MSIFPLPVFEADADPNHRSAVSDADLYAQLQPPKTIVVRFGLMKFVGEFPYDGDSKPGCGTKLVVRTHRGTELAEMLTTTCENAGCSKSVTRREMLEYIENSGGKEYPFHTDGRVLRVATIEDLNQQSAIQSSKSRYIQRCKELIAFMMLEMKLVEVEPILGNELITFYYMSEQRVDFRELVRELAHEFATRIEMRQVGARDEARLVADYERCGQHCCCKNFLKVLRPVSMRSAKVQKATLDPLKISGRCGRLMCCLRYEDQTYKELKSQLPRRNTRVGTSEGPGIVVDSKILVQLVLVKLEDEDREVAVPVEELMDPETCPRPGATSPKIDSDPLRGMTEEELRQRTDDRLRNAARFSRAEQQDAFREQSESIEGEGGTIPLDDEPEMKRETIDDQPRRRRGRRRGRTRGAERTDSSGDRHESPGESAPSNQNQGARPSGEGGAPSRRRRRGRRGGRRRRGHDGGGDRGSHAPPPQS